jgi:hypothetical protein
MGRAPNFAATSTENRRPAAFFPTTAADGPAAARLAAACASTADFSAAGPAATVFRRVQTSPAGAAAGEAAEPVGFFIHPYA